MNVKSLVRQRCALLIFSTFFFLVQANGFSQSIIKENFRFGAGISYAVPGGDLGKYWENYLTFSGIINYKLTNNFSLDGELSGSYTSPKTNHENLPSIVILNIPLGLKYKLNTGSIIFFSGSTGLENNTFIFTGEGAKAAGDNYIESEFSVFISISSGAIIFNDQEIELVYKYQSILSGPVNIPVSFIGLRILL